MHNHSHSASQENVGTRFIWGIALNFIFVCVELTYGYTQKSLSLLADAWHNLGDVAGLIISLIAIKMAEKLPTKIYTYGFSKATILASLANCLLLFIAISSMGYEAIQRFSEPNDAPGSTISWVAGVGVIINTLTAFLFMKNDELNSKAAFLHMAADAGVSLAVVIGGIAISYTHLNFIDPLLGLLICVVILWGTWKLFKDSLRLSLDGVPEGVSIEEVTDKIKSIPGVMNVDHLHIWALSTTRNALTANLVLKENLSPSEIENIKIQVREEVELHNNVHHSILETTQIHSSHTH